MNIPLSEAKGRLTELVRLAEAGEDVVLTRHGQAAARIVPVALTLNAEALRARRLAATDRAIREARERGSDGGPSAARSADYLYGDDGLPA